MVNVTLDPHGRLLTFHVVPPLMDEPSDAPLAPDWAALFAEAGLEMTNFKPTASRRVPRMGYDSRAAWEGVYPQQPQIPLRIEAAAYRGRAVWFEMIGPWTDPAPRPLERGTFGGPIFWLVFFLVIPLAGALLARRNLRLGRGDRKGAFRLALFAFALLLLIWVFTANFAAGIIQLDISSRTDLPIFIFASVLYWLTYLALEPYVRRRWPHRIIGWSRLLAGNIRDPLVGRDLLLGGLFAVGSSLLISLALKWPGLLIAQPLMADVMTLQGLRGLAISYLLDIGENLTNFG